jgi:hypothetical protein
MDTGEHDPWLAASTATLRAARGDETRIAEAVRDVCSRGRRELFLAPIVVWDYLAVSWPGLFGDAGYSSEELEQLMPVVEKAWLEAYDGWSPTEGLPAEPTAE